MMIYKGPSFLMYVKKKTQELNSESLYSYYLDLL